MPFAARRVLSVLRAEITSHFSWLESLGYAPPVFTEETSVLGSIINVTLTSPARELQFYVLAVPARLAGARRAHVMVVHLHRRDAGDERDTLGLEWFAVLHRRELADRLDELSAQRSSLSDYLGAALPVYSELLQTDLRPVVAAETWIGGNGDPQVVRMFEFLVTDYGCAPPAGNPAGIQQNHIYERGDVSISVAWEGSGLLSIAARGQDRRSLSISHEEAAQFLRSHPEVVTGDLRAVDALIRERQPPAAAAPRKRNRTRRD